VKFCIKKVTSEMITVRNETKRSESCLSPIKATLGQNYNSAFEGNYIVHKLEDCSYGKSFSEKDSISLRSPFKNNGLSSRVDYEIIPTDSRLAAALETSCIGGKINRDDKKDVWNLFRKMHKHSKLGGFSHHN
jgi:hypothetical protein